jgi:succinoglycan biosynthesis transport protein ExoP
MDFNQFLLALRARRKAFVMVFAATIITAIAVALIVPKKYLASATLLVDARDEQTMAPTRMSPRERAGYMSTQVDLIQSGRVAAQVVRDLKLAHKPGAREAFERDTGGTGTIEDWIAAGLLEKLKVETSSGNVLTVTYASSDPRAASAVANGFAKAYLDTALALRTEPTREAAAWFEGQLKDLRAQVNQAQTRLVSFQKAKGITFADERADGESARLAELSTQYLAAKNATYDAVTRYRQGSEAIAASESIPEVLASTHVGALKADLARAEARLEQMNNDLGPNHPAHQRTVAEIEGLREKLASEAKKVVAALGNAAQQAQKREEELKNALAAQQQRVHAMKEWRVDLAAMTRDSDNAQRSYDAVLARYMTNKIESAAKSTNVALLTPAIEPLKPAQPKVGLISGLSVVLGALLATAVVYVLETLDRRVRSRADLEARLAVPSLGRLSRWQPTGGRLLPAPLSAARALPHPW